MDTIIENALKNFRKERYEKWSYELEKEEKDSFKIIVDSNGVHIHLPKY